MREQRLHCPICKSSDWKLHILTKDFSVTQESFKLVRCNACTLVYTQTIPTEDAIAPYYNFDAYISHTNTNKGFFNKVYHAVRSFTLKQKLRWVKRYTGINFGSLLDIGCGVGSFLHHAKQKGWNITGIEPDANARQNAADINGINALPANQLFGLQQQFDAITMWHVLEHVHQLQEYFKQIKSLLAPQGIFVVAVPNYKSYDAAFYKEYWAAYDVPRHLYHFSPAAIQQLAAQHGLQVVAQKPMWFDSVYVSILSEKYKQGTALRGILIGLWSNCKALFKKENCSSISYILKHKD